MVAQGVAGVEGREDVALQTDRHQCGSKHSECSCVVDPELSASSALSPANFWGNVEGELLSVVSPLHLPKELHQEKSLGDRP